MVFTGWLVFTDDVEERICRTTSGLIVVDLHSDCVAKNAGVGREAAAAILTAGVGTREDDNKKRDAHVLRTTQRPVCLAFNATVKWSFSSPCVRYLLRYFRSSVAEGK